MSPVSLTTIVWTEMIWNCIYLFPFSEHRMSLIVRACEEDGKNFELAHLDNFILGPGMETICLELPFLDQNIF